VGVLFLLNLEAVLCSEDRETSSPSTYSLQEQTYMAISFRGKLDCNVPGVHNSRPKHHKLEELIGILL
jgi:hypothetical protein